MFSNLPNMNNGLDMFKNLLGNASGASNLIPGLGNVANMVLPTLDIEELDKRISDLKSVEQWLTLNQNMLRTTIQGLEVQRATLQALQGLGAMFKDTKDAVIASTDKTEPEAAKPTTSKVGKPIFEGISTPAPHVAPEPAPELQPEPAAAAPEAGAKGTETGEPPSALWWNLLNGQFSQIANAAAAANKLGQAAIKPLTKKAPAKKAPAKKAASKKVAAKKTVAKKTATKTSRTTK